MSLRMTFGGRRGGKMAAHRQATEAAARAGEHVHAAGRDGAWCVTSQPAGFLWARVPEWLRCAKCDVPLPRDGLCSDLALLTQHWMSEHQREWLELHPEDAPWLT